MAFSIRKIAPEDRDLFLSMSEEFYASDAVLHKVPTQHHLSCFEELMRSEDYARAYMLLWDGLEAGYALLSLSYSREAGGMCLWIEELYLRPEYQGRGAAHFFFDWLEQNARAILFYIAAHKKWLVTASGQKQGQGHRIGLRPVGTEGIKAEGGEFGTYIVRTG